MRGNRTALRAACLVIGTARHMIDTRAFSSVYMTFVTRLQSRPAREAALSRRSALSTLAREVTDSLSYDVNSLVEALHHILGSRCIMLSFDPIVMSICVALPVTIPLIARRYGARAVSLSRVQGRARVQACAVFDTDVSNRFGRSET